MLTAGSTTWEGEGLRAGSSGRGESSPGVSETVVRAGDARGGIGVHGSGTPRSDGWRGEDLVAPSGPEGANSNLLRVDAGSVPGSTEVAAAGCDTLLPRLLFSDSHSASASDSPEGCDSDAVGLLPGGVVGGGSLPPGGPPSPDIGLFSGRLTPVMARHALTGLLGGVISRASAPRASCVVRGAGPHLWALAAEAMGLEILRMEWSDRVFGELLSASGVGGRVTPLDFRSRGWEREGGPDLVFADQAGLAPPDQLDYWSRWRCPHVFCCKEGVSCPPPRDWTTNSSVVRHWEVGGSTDAVWSLEVWLPPGVALGAAPVLGPQPWIPLLGRLDKRERSVPCAAPGKESRGGPRVLPSPSQSGVVSSAGLFPHDRLSQRVLVPDDWSPTGFGTRSLSQAELGDLWDVPILLQDLIKGDVRWERVVGSLVRSPPAKILLMGGDAVVTRWLRGGGATKVRQRSEPTPRATRVLEGGGPGSKKRRNCGQLRSCLSGSEVRRRKRTRRGHPENKGAEEEATVGTLDSTLAMSEELDCLEISGVEDHSRVGRWITEESEIAECRPWVARVPVDVTFILEGEVSSSLPVVTKGDHQKADDADASTHLWSFFFKESFLSRFMVSRGRAGPWKRDGEDVYRRHPWNRREGMPEGWEGAMDGFRRMGLRWWRRNLLRTLRAWRTRHSTGPRAGREVPPHRLVAQSGPEGRYNWRRVGWGLEVYKAQWDAHHQQGQEGPRTTRVARDALGRAAGPCCRCSPDYLSGWWDWASGSTPFFWNWEGKYSREVRDGQPHFLIGEFGHYVRPQLPCKTAREAELVRKKVVPVRLRNYIEAGKVTSLTHYFWVQKGTEDIRMVYNGTGSGLNDAVWAPHFGLPYVTHTVRSLMPGYCQCDLDVGEMFLNFLLHEELKQLSGVDVSHVRSTDPGDAVWEESRGGKWERWCRNWMGLTDSPYRSIQWMIRLKMEAYGDPSDRANPFHWARVVLNLPGEDGYRPHLPWVMKLRWDGHLATEVFYYVDDGRATGFCREICWAAARQVAALCARYGVQDKAAKRTFPSPTPGPWAGTLSHTDRHEVAGMVSVPKWGKTKALIGEAWGLVEHALSCERTWGGSMRYVRATRDAVGRRRYEWVPTGRRVYKRWFEDEGRKVPHQRLLEIRGFLNYVVRTYPWMNPYLKGLHLTIDGWRSGRTLEGWRYKNPVVFAGRRDHEEDVGGPGCAAPPDAPRLVTPKPRLLRDLRCLRTLTDTQLPPRIRYRVKSSMLAFYVPGDASGSGFGSAVIDARGIRYQAGTWSGDWRAESSNFREADNLVLRLEQLGREGLVQGHEIFLFTDNFVFEACYYKGHSASEKLSDIMFRLHKAERDAGFKLHVIHVAGTRMKSWGVDGLSRGDLMEGMMAGKDPLSFIPLSEGADQRAGGAVRSWVDSWWGDWSGSPLVEVGPEQWFELQKVQGPRLWMPPPAAMETVMEVFNEDRLAHPWNPHVFVVPRLMTHLWRKNLGKDMDVLFTVQVGEHFWGRAQHEPLIVAVALPLVHVDRHRGPWLARSMPEAKALVRELDLGFKFFKDPRHPGLHELDRSLCRVWKDATRRSGRILQKFLRWARGFPPVHECLVRGLLQGVPHRPVPPAPNSGGRGRKRGALGGDGSREASARKRRGPPHGRSL